jgi:hypothetical protein
MNPEHLGIDRARSPDGEDARSEQVVLCPREARRVIEEQARSKPTIPGRLDPGDVAQSLLDTRIGHVVHVLSTRTATAAQTRFGVAEVVYVIK